ncbi:MAG: hypothetical protein CMN16_16535 [Roseovarius sp.]|nr:hypothetical protein [Roseovarius sp.]
MVVNSMVKTMFVVLFKAAMVWMVAISLLAIGFAHRPIPNAAQIGQAGYLAEFGPTAVDLCAESGDEDSGLVMGDCPACHLAGSILLLEPFLSFIDIELRATAAILVPAHMHGLGRTTNPATPVRAPPLA